MSTGTLKALLQTINYFRNWRKSDPENAKRHGLTYISLVFLAGLIALWVLHQHGLTVPADFAMFSSGLFLIDLFEFTTLVRISMALDPATGGILGVIGLGTLAKFFRDLGGFSAALNYFFAIR